MKYSTLQKVSKQICSQKISEVQKTILIRKIVMKGFFLVIAFIVVF
ncbi:hypothetical protein CU013_0644 [Enterococcus faecium]|nr:hypothetical protein HMPREF1347_01810 [Enterococcus faecium 504]MBK4753319.1 hypothetical protein [Enterococcus faecium]MBK4834308.1 hypothetical protein [Enterococcus faecium]